MAGFYVFNRWLWRIRPLPRLLGRPNFAGTWKGALRSKSAQGEELAPILAFLLIHQTFDSISLRLMTDESSSISQTAELTKSTDQVVEIVYTYQSVPRLLLQERSRIHYGAARLKIHGQPPERLEGAYWTDRNTQGEVSFTAYVAKSYSDFASATKGMASQSPLDSSARNQ